MLAKIQVWLLGSGLSKCKKGGVVSSLLPETRHEAETGRLLVVVGPFRFRTRSKTTDRILL